jgi:hypothetical protein
MEMFFYWIGFDKKERKQNCERTLSLMNHCFSGLKTKYPKRTIAIDILYSLE